MITREHQFEAAPLFSYNIFSRKRNSVFGNDLHWDHDTPIKKERYTDDLYTPMRTFYMCKKFAFGGI